MPKPISDEFARLRDEFAMVALPIVTRVLKLDPHRAYLADRVTEDDPDGLASDRRRIAVHAYRRRIAVHAYRLADEMLYVRTKNLSSYKD